jgi:hypothetical protein
MHRTLEPGPGAYKAGQSPSRIPVNFKKAKRNIVFRGGFVYVEEKQTSPGPMYNLRAKFTKKGVSFANGIKREVFKVNSTPGC